MAWQRAAQVSEVAPGRPKIIEANGRQIGVLQDGDTYFAVLNFCPHKGAPICQGQIFGAVTATAPGCQDYDHERRVLRCPWHRWSSTCTPARPWLPSPSGSNSSRSKCAEKNCGLTAESMNWARTGTSGAVLVVRHECALPGRNCARRERLKRG
jgi:3-phenylpropionate/trans-cinnamate dioxygenase ferredoxin subunit